MKVDIYFPADPSVGIYGYGYDMEIPTFDEDLREETRTMIKKLYDELDGEFTCQVDFEDEKDINED